MRLTNQSRLVKLKRKNLGNTPLIKAIDKLISDIEKNDLASFEDLKAVRKDADKVHSDGFYFFNINVHRTMILFEFGEDGEATVVWVGTHNEYENTFKNNKGTIEKWLRTNGFI